jgi:hypothetical protein
MQIIDHIEAQRRKLRTANLTFTVLIVVTACAIEFLPLPSAFGHRTRVFVFTTAFLLAAIASHLGAQRALRCPHCHGSLLRASLTVQGPVRRCPLCSIDFQQQMPREA